jgi:hypothetical protein
VEPRTRWSHLDIDCMIEAIAWQPNLIREVRMNASHLTPPVRDVYAPNLGARDPRHHFRPTELIITSLPGSSVKSPTPPASQEATQWCGPSARNIVIDKTVGLSGAEISGMRPDEADTETGSS